MEQICAALGRYYASLGKEYDSLFTDYCEDNGLDEDEIKDELDVDPSDSLLIDFDADFPFDPEREPKNKPEFIFNLIRKCQQNPDVTFEVKLPEFDQDLFSVKDKDLEEIKKIYATQCPVLWNSGMSTDGTFLQILAVAKKNKFDYLLHLVDDYSRDRVKHIGDEKGWNETDWSHSHRHFQKLKNVTVMVAEPGKGAHQMKCSVLATGAVISFGKRCTPKLLFTNMMFINDSLEVTVQYLYASINFISNLTKSGKTTCPFQVDMAIAVGTPKVDENTVAANDDDDDDDDDDDESPLNKDFVDIVGNVKAKLERNKLRYTVRKDLTKEARMFEDIYKDFVQENKLDLEQKDDKTDYLHKKRLIAFVDRRGAKYGDDEKEDAKSSIYMYEPPKNCQIIPEDAVPEWGISSSRTCLLPNMEYGDGLDAVSRAANSGNNADEDEKKVGKKEENTNIGTSVHCQGGLITFSFHVKAADVIKCYLYWNGTIIRFMPEDIKTILPKMFDMKFADNQAYIDKNKDLDAMIKEMQTKLVDKEFKAFQQSYS